MLSLQYKGSFIKNVMAHLRFSKHFSIRFLEWQYNCTFPETASIEPKISLFCLICPWSQYLCLILSEEFSLHTLETISNQFKQ